MEAEQAKPAARKLQVEWEKEIAMYEEHLAWSKKTEADLMRLKNDAKVKYDSQVEKLIAERQKAEVNHMAAEQKTKEAADKA